VLPSLKGTLYVRKLNLNKFNFAYISTTSSQTAIFSSDYSKKLRMMCVVSTCGTPHFSKVTGYSHFLHLHIMNKHPNLPGVALAHLLIELNLEEHLAWIQSTCHTHTNMCNRVHTHTPHWSISLHHGSLSRLV